MSNLPASLLGMSMVLSIVILMFVAGIAFLWLEKKIGFFLATMLCAAIASFSVSYFILYPLVTGQFGEFI